MPNIGILSPFLQACEKYVQIAPSGPETAPLRAKAHFRMALACLELAIKDATAFGRGK